MSLSSLLPQASATTSSSPSFPYLTNSHPLMGALRASMCKESRGKGSTGERKRQSAAGREAPTCGSGAEASRPVPLRCDTELPDLAWWHVRWARGTNGLEVEDWNFQVLTSPLTSSQVSSASQAQGLISGQMTSKFKKKPLNGDFPGV